MTFSTHKLDYGRTVRMNLKCQNKGRGKVASKEETKKKEKSKPGKVYPLFRLLKPETGSNT
jgi:hypothetical protein